MADFYTYPVQDSMIADARDFATKVFAKLGLQPTESDLNWVGNAILGAAVKASLASVSLSQQNVEGK